MHLAVNDRGELLACCLIDLKRFTASSVSVVEYPRCGRTRSLFPVKGVLRFPPHEPRKIQTEVKGKRWSATGKTDWDVVGRG
ncbi:MAG TPA: hypothetical protein VFV38_36045 [Ktedonobacteraceae bacterium]|nr:hypothetical protein [Ktedonobacteraceae bacterium]